jgi:hypothetical protein
VTLGWTMSLCTLFLGFTVLVHTPQFLGEGLACGRCLLTFAREADMVRHKVQHSKFVSKPGGVLVAGIIESNELGRFFRFDSNPVRGRCTEAVGECGTAGVSV